MNSLYKYCVLNSQKQNNCELISPMNHFSKNIRYLRETAGLSQAKFATGFGVSRDNIASYERGSEPKVEFLTKVVNFYHISLEDLLNTDLETICEENLTKSEKTKCSEENGGYLAGNSAGKMAGISSKESKNTNNSIEGGKSFPSEGNPMCLNCKKLEGDIFFLQDAIKAKNLTIAEKEEKIDYLNRQIGRLEGENERLREEIAHHDFDLGNTGT